MNPSSPAAREPARARRIVVTGATGFLGGHVARALAARGQTLGPALRDEVVATGRDAARGAALAAEGIPFVPCDLTDAAATHALLHNADAVVHCAALSSPWGKKRAFVAANVHATANVVAALRRGDASAEPARLVHVSTPSLYVTGEPRWEIRESEPLPTTFVNHYAATKFQAEQVVFAEAAAQAVVLRPRAIWGPGDTTLFPRLLTALKAGRLPQIGPGDNVCDLSHVENVVHAVLCALDAGPTACGHAYNITDGLPVRLWDVVGHLADALGLPRPQKAIAVDAAFKLATALEWVHRALPFLGEPPLTRYAVGAMSQSFTLDITKAKTTLGYTPPIAHKAGMAAFIAHLKAEGDHG